MQATGERRAPCIRPPLATDLGPSRDRLRIGTRQAAQPRGVAGERLIKRPLSKALSAASDLGEQVGTAGELAELGHRDGFLLVRQLVPAGEPPGRASQPGDEDTVSRRTIFDHAF